MLEENRDGGKSVAPRKRVNPAVGFGSAFAGGMAVFGLGGHWLDRKTGHESLFTLIGIGLGLLYGAWELWKLIAFSNQQAEQQRQNQAEKKASSPNDPSK